MNNPFIFVFCLKSKWFKNVNNVNPFMCPQYVYIY